MLSEEEHEISIVIFSITSGLILIVSLVTVFICCWKDSSEERTPLLTHKESNVQETEIISKTSLVPDKPPDVRVSLVPDKPPDVRVSLVPDKPPDVRVSLVPDKPPDVRVSPTLSAEQPPISSPEHGTSPDHRNSKSPRPGLTESPQLERENDQLKPFEVELANSYDERVKDRKKSAQKEEGIGCYWWANEARDTLSEKMAHIAEKMFSSADKFSPLPDLGSRLQKKWFLRGHGESMDMLQFVVKATNLLSTNLTADILTSLNMLLRKLEHPYLLRIYGVEMRDDLFNILLKFIPKGSLRDVLHRANPKEDWSVKYTSHIGQSTLSTLEVATCGRHILEALIALYEAGFPAIGQIHSGNVFRLDGRYLLGGYENILLGYRTSCYQDLAGNDDWLNRIDVIMFGHLMYEISTGEKLQCTVPDSNFKYEKVKNKDIKVLLKSIFKTKWRGSNVKTIKQIQKHPFFCNNLIDVTIHSLKSVASDTQDLLNHLTLAVSGSTVSLDQPELSDLNGISLKKNLPKQYKDLKLLERIGGNYWKMWATAKHSKLGEGLLCIAAVPPYCPIYVKKSTAAMKSLCSKISSKCRFIHEISDIQWAKVKDTWVVTYFQRVMTFSLKDVIHDCRDPLQPWSSKYHNSEPIGLDVTKVARYGYQILEAMLFLKEIDCSLLHYIHTGNIYIRGENCHVGGFENAFLKYRSQNLRIGYEYEDRIEVLIFGHVMYEMITGKVLPVAVPSEELYTNVNGSFREILRYIFECKSDDTEYLLHSLNDVIKNSFFVDYNKLYELKNISLTKEEVRLFQDIRKSKARNQDDIWKILFRQKPRS